MRTRLPAAVAAIAAALGLLAVTAVATAKPSRTVRHSLTIHTQPNPDEVGDPVVIFGRLHGPASGGKRVVLWHRLAGRAGFTPVGSVRTDARGFYLFVRAPGVVDTNRFWFVRADGARSRAVKERVIAAVTATGPQ